MVGGEGSSAGPPDEGCGDGSSMSSIALRVSQRISPGVLWLVIPVSSTSERQGRATGANDDTLVSGRR